MSAKIALDRGESADLVERIAEVGVRRVDARRGSPSVVARQALEERRPTRATRAIAGRRIHSPVIRWISAK